MQECRDYIYTSDGTDVMEEKEFKGEDTAPEPTLLSHTNANMAHFNT
jgi:hypothetical protein